MYNTSKALHWGRGYAPIIRPIVVALLAAFIIEFTALTGIQRGMDHKVIWGPESEQNAISIAISESKYGLHLGYVGFRTVHDKLVEIWDRGAANDRDPVLIENDHNAKLLNEALRAAASLGPQRLGHLSDGSLISMMYDDVGEVDFYRMAFGLFGLQIQASYYLFFALLSASAIIFILTFRNDARALAVLLCALFAFYIELHLNLFTDSAPTFPGMRNGSTLALVPMWYFVFLLPCAPSLGRIAGAAVQLFILVLAWRIRGSVSWVLIFLLALAALSAIKFWFRRSPRHRAWPDLIRATGRWPILVLLFGIAANHVYSQTVLNPIYFTDDVLPYHGAWHSAYLGFQYEPALLSPRVRAAYRQVGGSDTLGYYGALDYADRTHFLRWSGSILNPPPGYISPWTGQPKARLHDNIIRGAVLEALKKHPIDALALYVYQKPLHIFQVAQSVFPGMPRLDWLWLVFVGGFGTTLILLLCGCWRPVSLAGLVGMSVAATAFATLPNLWAYAGLHVVTDSILSFLMFAQITLGSIVFMLVQSGLRHVPSLERAMGSWNKDHDDLVRQIELIPETVASLGSGTYWRGSGALRWMIPEPAPKLVNEHNCPIPPRNPLTIVIFLGAVIVIALTGTGLILGQVPLVSSASKPSQNPPSQSTPPFNSSSATTTAQSNQPASGHTIVISGDASASSSTLKSDTTFQFKGNGLARIDGTSHLRCLTHKCGLSFSVQFDTANPSKYEVIVGQSGSGAGWHLLWTPGYLFLQPETADSSQIVVPFSPQPGRAYAIQIASDDQLTVISIDGLIVGTSGRSPMTDALIDLTVGGRNGASNGFVGRVSDLHVFVHS